MFALATRRILALGWGGCKLAGHPEGEFAINVEELRGGVRGQRARQRELNLAQPLGIVCSGLVEKPEWCPPDGCSAQFGLARAVGLELRSGRRSELVSHLGDSQPHVRADRARRRDCSECRCV